MEKYNCTKCEHNTGGVFNRNKKCEHCTVDSKDLKGKPLNFKEKAEQSMENPEYKHDSSKVIEIELDEIKQEIILIDFSYKSGSEEVSYFGNDVNKAFKEAKYQWERLTEREKKDRNDFYIATATTTIDKDTNTKHYDEIVKVHWDFKKYHTESNAHMLKLVKEYGSIYGHSDVDIVEIEELGMMALSGWNGEKYLDCWQSNIFGELIGEDSITLKPIQIPTYLNEDGEPEQWETLGYVKE